MKRILLICIAALGTTAVSQAQAEDVDGGRSHSAAELLELGLAAGTCTALIELGEFAIKDTRPDQASAFVSRFFRQFLDEHHNTPITLWKMCASIEEEYAAVEKLLGIEGGLR